MRAILPVIILLCTAAAEAAEPGALLPVTGGVYQIKSAGKRFTCVSVAGKWIAGRKDRAEPGYYVTYRTDIQNTKAALKTAGGKAKTKLKAKLQKLTASARVGDKACRGGPPGGGTATPTPTPALGNFDSNGNVTEKGKTVFGIPANLGANVEAGRAIHQQRCAGCHGDRTNRSFSALRQAIAESPMDYSESDIPDPELANITAYLNRFRP